MGSVIESNIGGGPSDSEKVKVSSGDTTANFLEQKLSQGSNITLTKQGAGSNETLEVSATGGGGGEANTASNVGTGGVGVFKQKTAVDLEFKKLNAGSNKITVVDDVGNNEIDVDVDEANLTDFAGAGAHGLVPDPTSETGRFLKDDGTWSSVTAAISTTANGTTIKEVTQESDFGPDVGGIISLTPNTTYLVRGIVVCTNQLSVAGDGIAVMGFNRELDQLSYSGTASLFDVVDRDLTVRNLWLRATNAAGQVITAINITPLASANNYGRLKVLELMNLKVANSTNIWTIEGFELVDVSNCLIWYIADGTIGARFKSCRHLEITSCEFYNWFEEGNSANLDYYKMIEVQQDSAVGVGNGVVNINSSIIHPETVQEGVSIDPASTTGFGTIASNTFTDTNLTTGSLADFDYNVQKNYIIQANQGIANGNAKGTLSIIANVNDLDTGTTNPQVLKPANVATGAFSNTPTFPIATRVITSVTDCSFTYDTKIEGNFWVAVTGTVEMSGDGFIACRLRANGTAFSHAIGLPEIRQGRAQSFTFTIIGVANFGDVFDVEFESFNTSMSSTPKDIKVREFVLNGYQF